MSDKNDLLGLCENDYHTWGFDANALADMIFNGGDFGDYETVINLWTDCGCHKERINPATFFLSFNVVLTV